MPIRSQDAALVELGTLSEDGTAREPTPLVFIEGWAAGTSAKLFTGLDNFLNERKSLESQSRRMLVIKCGCYSSLWDRAHEIYYALKGGRCDYGEDHAKLQNHARYGKTHVAGLYENWSEEYPLHFAGHSFGGVTIFHLQQLLGTVLPGSPTWFKSIVTISSPLRGTPLAAAFGQLDGEGGQKRFSLGWLMAASVHLAKTVNVIGTDLYDFGGDQWMTKDKDESDSKYTIIDSWNDYLSGRSMGFSADTASFDMLVSSMAQHNKGSRLCEKTYYRSYTAITEAPLYLPPFAYCHHLISSTSSETACHDPDWTASDCFVPAKSQMHPGDCHETTCLHIPNEIAFETEPPPLPGVWHVKVCEDTTHFGLVNYLWSVTNSAKTREFWGGLGEWLTRVDGEAESTAQEGVKEFSVSIVDA